MNSINKLFADLEQANKQAAADVDAIKSKLQTELNARFDDWQALQTVVSQLLDGNGVRYCADEYGDVESWLRFDALQSMPDQEREFLEAYLGDNGIRVDWMHQTLSQWHGDEEIFISEDGRDAGVYQGRKLIIDASDYRDDNGDVDEVKRNELIEAHMERTGYYPGVYKTSYYDNSLTPVSTCKK